MKISKLFHWLYACVMLLPIFAIGVTCLVNTFNNEAKNECKVNYKYETNDINNGDEFKLNYIYKLNTATLDRSETKMYFYCSYIEIFDFTNTTTNFSSENYGNNYRMGFYYDGSYNNFVVRLYNNNTIITNIFSNGYQRFNYINIVITELIDNSIQTQLSIVPQNEIEIESIEQKDISNVFYYSIDRIQESPLFNWAYNSFLVTPFAYIVNLFSMPSNSFVVMLLSYWLAISIIWLVFDLVMYVPLLVHRWLDKGLLE